MLAFEAVLDCSMTYGGPVYVAVAVLLILAVGCVFFAAVLPLVCAKRRFWSASATAGLFAAVPASLSLQREACRPCDNSERGTRRSSKIATCAVTYAFLSQNPRRLCMS